MLFNVHEVHWHIQQLMNQMHFVPIFKFEFFSHVSSNSIIPPSELPQDLTGIELVYQFKKKQIFDGSILTIEPLTFWMHHSIKWNRTLTRLNFMDETMFGIKSNLDTLGSIDHPNWSYSSWEFEEKGTKKVMIWKWAWNAWFWN